MGVTAPSFMPLSRSLKRQRAKVWPQLGIAIQKSLVLHIQCGIHTGTYSKKNIRSDLPLVFQSSIIDAVNDLFPEAEYIPKVHHGLKDNCQGTVQGLEGGIFVSPMLRQRLLFHSIPA